MTLAYVIKVRAKREIEHLAEWWAVNRGAAPGAVRLDVEGVLFVLTRHPRLGHKVETGRPVQVRRYLMTRTQHWLYFRVKANVLEVLSGWSTSREREPKFEHSGACPMRMTAEHEAADCRGPREVS